MNYPNFVIIYKLNVHYNKYSMLCTAADLYGQGDRMDLTSNLGRAFKKISGQVIENLGIKNYYLMLAPKKHYLKFWVTNNLGSIYSIYLKLTKPVAFSRN